MPLYEFVCRDCSKTFTALLTLAEYDKRNVVCPDCQGRRIDRVWSAAEVITSRKS